MIRILDNEPFCDFLDKENRDRAMVTTRQLQIHIDYVCGCKITQDKLADHIFPCKDHNQKISELSVIDIKENGIGAIKNAV